ncbi:MAG: sugar transferase [Sporolactobacillus sp.]
MAMPKTQLDARYLEQASRTELQTSYAGNKIAYLFIKRALDIFGAVVGLVVSSPLFLLISLLYLAGGQRGPVFFKQRRIGQFGKPFYIYKFRSMICNAERVLKSNKVLYQKYLDNSYKLEPEEDPRITKIGRFLRKTSLDELPQLINVLKGEMSLVGPRPVVSEELKEYKENRLLFLSVKPGLTGNWQVCGRSEIEYPERCDVELYYVQHQALALDLKIIFKTIVAVLTKKGAY